MFAGINITARAYYYNYFKTRSKKLVWWIIFQFGKSKKSKDKDKEILKLNLQNEANVVWYHLFL